MAIIFILSFGKEMINLISLRDMSLWRTDLTLNHILTIQNDGSIIYLVVPSGDKQQWNLEIPFIKSPIHTNGTAIQSGKQRKDVSFFIVFVFVLLELFPHLTFDWNFRYHDARFGSGSLL